MNDPESADELAKRAGALVQIVSSGLSDLLNAAGEILDAPFLASLLADVRDIKQDAARVYDEIERFYLAECGDKKLEVLNLGIVEVKSSVRRTAWDHDSLWKVVVARALDERQVDPDTGELLEREAETISRVLRECASPSWRVTALRARGIDESEFCSVDETSWSVKLPPRKEAA